MDRVIVKGRGRGKTTDLIKECAANPNGIIVCAAKVWARHVKQMADDLGLKIRMPITHSDMLCGDILMGSNLELYIDDLDALINNVARGRRVRTATISGEIVSEQNRANADTTVFSRTVQGATAAPDLGEGRGGQPAPD